jgi:superfamily II DNA helicase RecQ
VESFWAFCIAYLDKNAGGETFAKKDKTDYRYVLNERDFAVYSRLRLLRKTLAERDGIPVYAIFTNEQLAAMVRESVKTEADLLRITGVGKARVEKYGREFLLLLCKEYDKEAAGEENKN